VKPVHIRSDAEADIEEAFQWYETERAGLGVEFREALRRMLRLIAENPGLYPPVERNARRASLRRFPYGVYYRELPDAIIVFACLHGHRDPGIWRSRL
jgi:plasmid stabilization system protein ParE